ncbi:hypothetical protein KAH37_07735 [bacterium]|nr:hypothetical protein [bacterium]
MRFFWVLSFVALLFVACGGEETAGSECLTKEDCPASQICVGGLCINPDDTGSGKCETAQDCAFGFTCIDHICVQMSGDTAGDTSGDSAGDTAGDSAGDSGDSGQDDVADSGDSVTDTADTTDTAADNSVQPDETVITDEDVDETADEDVDSGDVACVNTAACSEDTVCVAEKCRDPFDFQWSIGNISLTVTKTDSGGENWDPLGNKPDPYVVFKLNESIKFETSVAENSYDGTYSESYSTYLMPADALTFMVVDEDGGLNLSDNDLMETFHLNPINPKWLHDGKYNLIPTTHVPKFIVYFDIIL